MERIEEVRKQRKELEESISKATEAIVAQKVCLNALLPVARLPAELLVEIFVQYLKLRLKTTNGHNSAASAYSWLDFTHVCHHWRDVALRSASLWTSVTYTSKTQPDCALTMLKRSQIYPVFLKIDVMEEEQVSETALTVFKAIDRAHTLHLSFPAKFFKSLRDMGPRDLPHLQSLSIRSSATADLPPLFSRSNMPQLRELSLSRLRLDWSKPIFHHSLKKLSIYGDISNSVFAALKKMPNLNHLELGGGLRATEPDHHYPVQHNPHTPISLPQLTFLGLSGAATQVMHTLNTISFPANASLSLEMVIDILRDEEWNEVATSLSDKLVLLAEAEGGSPIRSFSSWGIPDPQNVRDTVRIDLYRDTPTVDMLATHDGDPSYRIALHSESLDGKTFVQSFGTLLPVANVTHAYMGGDFGFLMMNKALYTKILQTMPNLEALYMDDCPSSDLEKLLKMRVESAPQPNATKKGKGQRNLQWIFPRLRTLVLEGQFYHDALSDTVQARAKSGCGLERLEFKRMKNFNAKTLAELQSFLDIPRLVWDGVVVKDHHTLSLLDGFDDGADSDYYLEFA